MSKTTAFILLVIFSFGFSFSIYVKYIKTDYVQGVEKAVKTTANENISRKLSLNQTIVFLNNFDKIKSINGITTVTGDENAKVLKRLKTINVLSVSGMVVFFLLCILKSMKQALPLRN